MIFKQYQQILDGSKTQTRRPVKAGEYSKYIFPDGALYEVFGNNGRLKWRTFLDYAVQPGRGKPAIWIPLEGAPIDDPLAEYIRKTESVRATWGPKVKAWLRAKGYQEARIRITKIRRERLQEISLPDMKAEGIRIRPDRIFPSTLFNELAITEMLFKELWNPLYRKPFRWEDNPEVWCLSFELVKTG